MVEWIEDWLARRRHGEAALAAVLLAPIGLILGVFGVAPLFYAVYLSLFEGKVASLRFAWGANYAEAFQSPDFWNSVAVTFYYTAGTVPLTMLLSFLVAMGLFRLARGRGLFRTVYFLPYVTSAVAAATVWRVMLHGEYGVVNHALGGLGLPRELWQDWLLEPHGVLYLLTGGMVPSGVGPSLALCCVIAFDVWHNSGFMIVIMLAGLSTIPRELEEAAVIDGAGWFRRMRHVVLPLLSPTLFFLLIVSVIRAFQGFNSFYALTGDGRGPYDSTQNLTVYIFTNLYVYTRVGYGAAVATLLAAAIVLLTLLQWRYVGRRVYYG